MRISLVDHEVKVTLNIFGNVTHQSERRIRQALLFMVAVDCGPRPKESWGLGEQVGEGQ